MNICFTILLQFNSQANRSNKTIYTRLVLFSVNRWLLQESLSSVLCRDNFK